MKYSVDNKTSSFSKIVVEANYSNTFLTLKIKLDTQTHKFKHLFTSLYIEVCLTINVDVLPLFRSSSVSLWPILCKFNNHVFTEVFPIALFVSIGKPSFENYILPIAEELKEFKNNYISINAMFFKINRFIFVCDEKP